MKGINPTEKMPIVAYPISAIDQGTNKKCGQGFMSLIKINKRSYIRLLFTPMFEGENGWEKGQQYSLRIPKDLLYTFARKVFQRYPVGYRGNAKWKVKCLDEK